MSGKRLRILTVSSGASWSTHDVYMGMAAALKRQGHELVDYHLEGRIVSALRWLAFQWKRNNRTGSGRTTKPTGVDAHYLASFELPYRALRHNVDWVYVVNGSQLHPDALVMCRLAGIPLAIHFTESPYEDSRQIHMMSIANLVWTNERTSVGPLRQALDNPNVHYLAHAYDPERHHPGEPDPSVPAHDVVFVGTGWEERIKLLSAVDWTGIDLGLYGEWGGLGSRSHLRRHLRERIIPNSKTIALYRRAKIGLNLYRTSASFERHPEHVADAGESMNPRALELSACGAFHISQPRKEGAEVLETLVPTFETAEQLEGLIRRYLPDERRRREIAARLPQAVEGWTFDARADQIVAHMARACSREGAVVA